MSFNHNHYVPCLRWKQGEYQAVWRLSNREAKKHFTPLIEVPEIGWDFEKKKEAKSIDDHITPFAKRIFDKWGTSLCFIDLHLIKPDERMEDNTHPIQFVFDKLRELKCHALPVTGLNRDIDYQREVKKIVAKNKLGVCLRVNIEETAKHSFKSDVDTLLSQIETQPIFCALVIDLGSPNFLPVEGLSVIIQNIIKKLPYIDKWKDFILLGTSFPETMAVVKKGGELFVRQEWKLYKILIQYLKKAKLRLPTFSDYGISHPNVANVDMRLVKPAATIRYTTNEAWYIVKGKNVRDNDSKQYCQLSELILNSSYYCGPEFSWGDECIKKCGKDGVTTNSLTIWRQVGTNHHIEKAVNDLANFHASLGNS